MKTPNWDEIEKAVKVVMCITADTMRSMMGFGPNADKIATDFLGFKGDLNGITSFYSAAFLDDSDNVYDESFLLKIKAEDTHIQRVTRRCYNLVTHKPPLNEVNTEDERSETTDWLWFFLSTIPGDTHVSDPSWIRTGENSPLKILHDQTDAYLTLVEFVGEVFWGDYGTETHYPYTFSANNISRLADINIRSVRNVMGPGGQKEIQTQADAFDRRTSFGHGLQALEWLANKRGFNPGSISQTWAHEEITNNRNLAGLLAIPCVYAWIHGVTTEELAGRAGMTFEGVHEWLKCKTPDADTAMKIASAAGLDGEIYAKRISEITN